MTSRKSPPSWPPRIAYASKAGETYVFAIKGGSGEYLGGFVSSEYDDEHGHHWVARSKRKKPECGHTKDEAIYALLNRVDPLERAVEIGFSLCTKVPAPA